VAHLIVAAVERVEMAAVAVNPRPAASRNTIRG